MFRVSKPKILRREWGVLGVLGLKASMKDWADIKRSCFECSDAEVVVCQVPRQNLLVAKAKARKKPLPTPSCQTL